MWIYQVYVIIQSSLWQAGVMFRAQQRSPRLPQLHADAPASQCVSHSVPEYHRSLAMSHRLTLCQAVTHLQRPRVWSLRAAKL